MKTITREVKEVLKWLEDNHKGGIELNYIDYRDELSPEQLQEVLKDGDLEDDSWIYEQQDETIDYLIDEYRKENDDIELSDEAREAFQEWCYEHDTSDIIKGLLKNTGDELMFIETEDEIIPQDEDNLKALLKKYGKTDEQKAEIKKQCNELFYQVCVSFYFNLDSQDIYQALHEDKGKYINIRNCYFSTIDRGQGSNWLGDKAIFDISIPKEQFIKTFFVDRAKGTGYSWREICGQTGYESAVITCDDEPKYMQVIAEISQEQEREMKLQAQWDKTHKCVKGDYDMNYNRHSGNKYYENNYPCGTHCDNCGTFWID